MPEINRSYLIKTNKVFSDAHAAAQKMTLEELFEKIDKIYYPSFGTGALMIFKWQDIRRWDCGFRNPKNWDETTINFTDQTIKRSLEWMYAWSIYKGYL